MKISLHGCGSFGYALALLLSKAGKEVHVYDIKKEFLDGIKEKRKHPVFHKDMAAPKNIIPVYEPEECHKDSDLVIMAVPAQILRDAVASISDVIPKKAIILNVSKALEKKTDKRMSEVIKESIKNDNPVATISGGMISHDVAHGKPVGADIASEDPKALEILKEVFEPTTVKIDVIPDIKGVEYAGAFKNPVSIGAGIIDGLDLESSSKAYFVIELMKEMERLAIALGSDPSTFMDYNNSWTGDLLTCCFGRSRNREIGELLGKGLKRKEAEAKLLKKNKYAEGIETMKVVNDLLKEHKIEAPLLRKLHSIIYEDLDAKELIS